MPFKPDSLPFIIPKTKSMRTKTRAYYDNWQEYLGLTLKWLLDVKMVGDLPKIHILLLPLSY
jgi:hypothetical protein